MLPIADLLASYRWSCDTMRRLVSDVPDEAMTSQPVEGINHPAWLLGHVNTYHDVIAHLLRGEAFDNPWDAPCGMHSTPTADRGAYPPKSEILAVFDAGAQRAAAAIESAPAEAWSRPVGHPTWGKRFASVSDAVMFLATDHLSFHAGQLSGWRRAMGMPRI